MNEIPNNVQRIFNRIKKACRDLDGTSWTLMLEDGSIRLVHRGDLDKAVCNVLDNGYYSASSIKNEVNSMSTEWDSFPHNFWVQDGD